MAKARTYGSGWHKQSPRHSNARKFGRAGGQYASNSRRYGRANPTLPLRTTKLPIQFSIVVPSTKDRSKPLTKKEFDTRIQTVAKDLSTEFGGDTSIRGRGGYVDEKGKLIEEPVAVIEASMSRDDFEKNKGKLAEYVKEKKDKWGQESIGYKVEDDFYIYPKF